MWRLSSM